MTDTITITGLVATAPRHVTTNSGADIVSFRLASAQRRYDRRAGRWVDVNTNWYTVTTFRQLARNALGSVACGDRVIVSGRLSLRGWESGGRSGLNVDVEAESLGHDLSWGTSRFVRGIASAQATAGRIEEESRAVGDADGRFSPGTMRSETDEGSAVGGIDHEGWSLPGGPGLSAAASTAPLDSFAAGTDQT